jgi:tRNA modification GTPase
VRAGAEVEIIAAELREARRFLEALVGKIGVEDILGEIFGRFCIGK